jgi:hypothetical protein
MYGIFVNGRLKIVPSIAFRAEVRQLLQNSNEDNQIRPKVKLEVGVYRTPPG